ncbi:DUF2157 domain-containing protein [Niastella caeni]|uniref:DUF2157 domain-containing protein n=1 Tax=Niastella caeni TaxID=2569763 RepID=A0A4S8HEU7_9BACT|nr:DUF2157 domain-containing protein [Niastella caeni]THU33413.1 DUF2157 domain-containing protein [Niastella caeni]
MDTHLFEKLYNEGLISAPSFQKIKLKADSSLFSVHWELKTILYLGILLLTGGLGILIYKNIDTIGHQVILAAIGLLCIGCFFYCERKKLPFAMTKVQAPNSFFDYILLLGCLTLITFITYLQVQYTAFGNAYGLATFIPMVILFFCAYYFDHLGVLSMAITNLAAWMGIAITPLNILKANDFEDAEIIFAGLFLGVALNVIALLSKQKNIKAHFSFTYTNFGMNILFIACLAGMFHFDDWYILWLLPLAAIAFFFYRRSLATASFYFMLLLTLYGYIGISYVIIRLLIDSRMDMGAVYFGFMYFIVSGIGMIVFLSRMNKKLKHNDSL